MLEVFTSKSASVSDIYDVAEWVRSVTKSASGKNFDVIKFIEVDLLKFFPDLYVYIESDFEMGSKRAYICDEPLGMVVSESIYESASNGCLFSTEIILHEVGHLFLHHEYSKSGLHSANARYTEQIINTKAFNSVEWQADIFAQSMLYPIEETHNLLSIENAIKKYKISNKQAYRILDIKKKFELKRRGNSIHGDRRFLKMVSESIRKFRSISMRKSTEDQFSFFYTKKHDVRFKQELR